MPAVELDKSIWPVDEFIDKPLGAEKVPPVTPDKLGVGSTPDLQ